MSHWIDDALTATATRRLFAAVLAARDRLESDGALPPTGPDPGARSYWEPRPAVGSGGHARPLFETHPADAAGDRLGEALRDLWSEGSPAHPDGLSELTALVPQFVALAVRLRRAPASRHSSPTSNDSLPALIYPLF